MGGRSSEFSVLKLTCYIYRFLHISAVIIVVIGFIVVVTRVIIYLVVPVKATATPPPA